jgi:hypothetical protein
LESAGTSFEIACWPASSWSTGSACTIVAGSHGPGFRVSCFLVAGAAKLTMERDQNKEFIHADENYYQLKMRCIIRQFNI